MTSSTSRRSARRGRPRVHGVRDPAHPTRSLLGGLREALRGHLAGSDTGDRGGRVNIEAELKARLSDRVAVKARLDALALGESERYRDTYFHVAGDRELRIRTVESAGEVRHILTYKEPPVDAISGSRPEYETLVADPTTTATILD